MTGPCPRLAAALLCVLATLATLATSAAPVRAQDDEPEVLARVIVDQAQVRSGPGASYRRIYTAKRNEIFPVRARDTRAYWFRIELPDGTVGFVQGEAVHTLEIGDGEVDDGRFLPEVFAPPPMLNAHGEVSLVGGAFGSGGMIALRAAVLLDPTFGFEVTSAAAVAPGGRLLLALVGPIVNLFPRSPIVPLLTLSAGTVASSPSSDTFLLESGSVTAVAAGAGVRIGFRYRLTLRLEVRSYVMFDADRYRRQEELSAGLTVFF